MYFLLFVFCYLAPNNLGGHSGPFSLHLSHQDSVLSMINPLEIGGAGGAIYLHTWYYTRMVCTEWNVSFLGTRNLVY